MQGAIINHLSTYIGIMVVTVFSKVFTVTYSDSSDDVNCYEMLVFFTTNIYLSFPIY